MPPEEGQEEQPIIIKKIYKKAGHGGGHGGAWKVAYADFVTAMMCLFLLLWLLNVDPASKAVIADAFKQPTQMGPLDGNVFIFGGAKRPGEEGKFEGGASFMQFEKLKLTGENKDRVMKALKKEFKEELEMDLDESMTDNVSFHIVKDGIIIQITETDDTELFASGSAALTRYAKNIIDHLSHILSETGSMLILTGHTDGSDFSDNGYDNWSLSTDRAQALRQRLIIGDISPDRIFRIEGYADRVPLLKENTKASMNRRITITLLTDDRYQEIKKESEIPVSELNFVKQEKSQEAELKSNYDSHDVQHYIHKSAGKTDEPPSLEQLKARRRRKEYYAENPIQLEEASGGH